MKQLILAIFFLPMFIMAQKSDDTLVKINPKLTVQGGFCIPEFYNLGYEANLNYYPYGKSWLRLGPAFQMNNFYVVNNNWFNSNNKEQSISSELRFNVLFNVEFIPFKKSTFYVGIAPYIGYQWLNNNGSLQNATSALDIRWNYDIHTFDFGSRYKLGGYFGKKQRYGMEGALQISHRGIADENTLSNFFNFGMPTYKTYIAISFVYRII